MHACNSLNLLLHISEGYKAGILMAWLEIDMAAGTILSLMCASCLLHPCMQSPNWHPWLLPTSGAVPLPVLRDSACLWPQAVSGVSRIHGRILAAGIVDRMLALHCLWPLCRVQIPMPHRYLVLKLTTVTSDTVPAGPTVVSDG